MESVSNISTIQETPEPMAWFLSFFLDITNTAEYPLCESSFIGGELE